MYLLLSLATLLLSTAGLNAHVAADASGHWEGVITAQFGTVRIELDIARDASGQPTGTFSAPERKLIGLPLLTLKVEGNAVQFEPAAIGARFEGDLNAAGTEIAGVFQNNAGSIPLVLTRKGDAQIAAPPRNAAVSKELEGTWSGALHVEGTEKRLLLTLKNNADQTASATVTSVDEGGLELRVGFVRTGSGVAIDIKAVGSSYAAALSADGTEMVGTYTTSEGFELPLTLRKK